MATKRRRQSAAVTRAELGAGRARITLDIGPDAMVRLRVHALKTGRSPGDLVEELIEANLPQWVIQERGRKSGQTEAAA
jgi:hypothetical protein